MQNHRNGVRAGAIVTLLSGAFLAASIPASAATITGYEIIRDTTCTSSGSSGGCEGTNSSASNRDLERTRQVGSGSPVTTGTDSTIVSQNNVDNHFGFFDSSDVTFRHTLNWFAAPPSGFLSAVLTIRSYGASNSNDYIIADTVTLGNLGNGGNSLATKAFGVVAASLNDGVLNVTLDKSSSDSINIFSSRLDFSYDDTVPMAHTPEPASLVLLGTGVAGFVARQRRRRKNQIA